MKALAETPTAVRPYVQAQKSVKAVQCYIGDTRLPARFWSKVKVSSKDCWLWTGCINPEGYSRFSVERKKVPAHRVSYTFLVGEIPKGLHIDHLCRVRSCVNPEHLEPVTIQENIKRGDLWKFNGTKTCCPSGHPYSGDNLKTESSGRRRCRVCRNIQDRARYTRNTIKRGK